LASAWLRPEAAAGVIDEPFDVAVGLLLEGEDRVGCGAVDVGDVDEVVLGVGAVWHRCLSPPCRFAVYFSGGGWMFVVPGAGHGCSGRLLIQWSSQSRWIRS